MTVAYTMYNVQYVHQIFTCTHTYTKTCIHTYNCHTEILYILELIDLEHTPNTYLSIAGRRHNIMSHVVVSMCEHSGSIHVH